MATAHAAMGITRLSPAEVLASLQTPAGGLGADEARRRLREFGPNRIEEVRGRPLWLRLLREFTHFFALILWVAAALAFVAELATPGAGMWQLGTAILAVIFVNGVFSFLQEYRAERALSALRELLPASARVVRDGAAQVLPVESLVPGDLVELEAGDNVPADARLVEVLALRLNLSTLTGESVASQRVAEGLDVEEGLTARNLVFAGTSVVSGRGRAVVYATGMRTQFGRIAHLTQTVGQETSLLQQEIGRLSRIVALLASTIGVLFFAVGIAAGMPLLASGMFAIGIIVANVPEGLLPTVTLSLAMATQRMARRNALVRHLPSVETLGSTTVICSDKTGTLTLNDMSVRQVYDPRLGSTLDPGEPQAGDEHLLRNARECHDLRPGRREGRECWLGDPMEIALAQFGHKHGVDDARRIAEIPFDSDRRLMSVVVLQGDRRWLYCKGAPEAVLDRCRRVSAATTPVPFDASSRRLAQEAQAAMAQQGLRVLGFAYRECGADETPAEEDLVFSGLVGLRDPPRPEVAAAIERCRTAGIKVVMVTGDHPQTAVALGREVGLILTEEPRVIHGEKLVRMTPAQLQLALDAPEILFTRVTAEQKMQVVEALKRKGHIVAVTGDGVNDAPALRAAHIGIAMGVTGTDVARESADLVLLDDNFASIVNAIEEGRAVYQNLRKFLTYILTSNVPELVPYLAYVLFRIPLPLTVIQILAVDLGTDMLPALALGAERPQGSLMREPPRPRSQRLLSGALLVRAYAWLGMLQAAAAMTAFWYVLHRGGWQYGEPLAANDPLYLKATTACFAAIVVAQVVNVFHCRDPRASAFSFRFASNPLLLLGVAVEILLLLAIVYTPVGQVAIGTGPLDAETWALLIALGALFGGLEEGRKLWSRVRRRQDEARLTMAR